MYILRALVVGIAISPCAAISNGETQLSPAEPSTQRAIPHDDLAYPVRVEIHGSGGSGFFLNTERQTYFVTAKHVLFSLDADRFCLGFDRE
jgi:hypothetical protein